MGPLKIVIGFKNASDLAGAENVYTGFDFDQARAACVASKKAGKFSYFRYAVAPQLIPMTLPEEPAEAAQDQKKVSPEKKQTKPS